ncbi:phenoloxidase-activating factor 3-like isoform X2 [Neocloeon triangulifer]|uniref:phenoloxidase-activating factor 3-like isoform X2 n=1 Tax=Neocloeon triangulifer TaxID=2078957 RepID=UPI00286F8352|nr:phenoloxidase-activating factor 3-like isoform X2 [Neocloeon triangulifer]
MKGKLASASLLLLVSTALTQNVILEWRSALRLRYAIGGHFSPASASKLLLRTRCPGHKRVCCPAWKVVHHDLNNTRADPKVYDPETTTLATPGPDKKRRHLNRRLLEKSCAQQPLEFRVAFGEEVKAGQLPWLAILRFSDNGTQRFSCGGSLITDQYILTAAHCAKPLKKSMKLVSARLGEVNLASTCDQVAEPDDLLNDISSVFGDLLPKCAAEPQDVEVDEVRVHPEFSYDFIEGFPHDLALVRLKHKVKATMFVRPICLRGLHPDEGRQGREEGTAKVAGWGMTDMSEGPRSNELRQVAVKRVARQVCRDEHRVMVRERCQKCAGSSDGSACMGDSGGPLLQEMGNTTLLAGVVSYGSFDCGTSAVPSVFSDVSCYLDWIIDTIRP